MIAPASKWECAVVCPKEYSKKSYIFGFFWFLVTVLACTIFFFLTLEMGYSFGSSLNAFQQILRKQETCSYAFTVRFNFSSTHRAPSTKDVGCPGQKNETRSEGSLNLSDQSLICTHGLCIKVIISLYQGVNHCEVNTEQCEFGFSHLVLLLCCLEAPWFQLCWIVHNSKEYL